MSSLCCERGTHCLDINVRPEGGTLKQLFFVRSPFARRAHDHSPLEQTTISQGSAADNCGDHQDPMQKNGGPQPRTSLPTIRPRLFNRLTLLLLSGWIGIVGLAFELTAKDTAVTQLPVLEVFLKSLL